MIKNLWEEIKEDYEDDFEDDINSGKKTFMFNIEKCPYAFASQDDQ